MLAMLALYVCLFAAAVFDPAVWVETFDKVWSTIRDYHYDPRLKGLDWNKAREDLRPKVAAAVSAEEARRVVRELLGRLGESHHGIIPKEAYGDDAESPGPGTATAGIDVRFLQDEGFVVTRVEPGSPADAAGIRTGWTLRRVDGKDISGLLQRGLLSAELAVAARLQGQPGKAVALGFDEAVKTVTLADPVGAKLVRFGNLPPVAVRYDARLVGAPGKDAVGYLRIASFFDPEALQHAAAKLLDLCSTASCKGVVIDLRGNPGGLGILATTLTGWLVDKPVTLGTMRTREMTLKLTAAPRPHTLSCPVAVLQDGHSMSTSEFTAGGLKDIGRARVFGAPTPGFALPSQVIRLPSGDRLQFVTAHYVSHSGQPLEGNGVQPDELIRPTRAALLAGRDEVMEAALTWLSTINEGAEKK